MTRALEDWPRCATCGKPASCLGRYEAMDTEEYACDECCGHGCEDGYCASLDGYWAALAAFAAPEDN